MSRLKTFGTLLLAGSLAPAGVLLAQPATAATPAVNTHTSQMDPASMNTSVQNKFTRIHDLSQKAGKDVAPLKFGTNGTELNWKVHSIRLARAKKAVNQVEKDVKQLESRKAGLTPWQRQLLGNVKEDAHEMVYQTRAAVKVLNAHHNKNALALTSYPQNIDMIWQKANDAAEEIGTVFQRHGGDID